MFMIDIKLIRINGKTRHCDLNLFIIIHHMEQSWIEVN